MDRTPTPLTDARAQAPPATAAVAPAGVPVRELPVAVGQVLQATVTAIDGDTVWLGWRGALFEARTLHLLEPGRSYDFLVNATEPHIVLSAVKAVTSEGATGARLLPGSGAAEWMRSLVAVLAALPEAPSPPLRGDASPRSDLARTLQAFAEGKATAAELQSLQRELGHDQEARVLRLATLPPERLTAEVESLRHTRKAAALALLADAVKEDQPPRDALHRALTFVSGLNGVERDNAHRADQGLPLWLPLPACPALGLRDARMFLLAEERGGDEPDAAVAADGAFTVVLLLDLTRLGELRVDIALRGERVDVTFVAVRPGVTALLARTADELRGALTAAGLQVDRLAMRQARGRDLPVADLVLPPRDGSAMVDCHA